MNPISEQLIRAYLKRLNEELADLPSARRREIVDEISEHIDEARASGAADEASVRSLLDRLGDPADIAADARERFGVGGLVLPVLGWFVGVALLWASAV